MFTIGPTVLNMASNTNPGRTRQCAHDLTQAGRGPTTDHGSHQLVQQPRVEHGAEGSEHRRDPRDRQRERHAFRDRVLGETVEEDAGTDAQHQSGTQQDQRRRPHAEGFASVQAPRSSIHGASVQIGHMRMPGGGIVGGPRRIDTRRSASDVPHGRAVA
jgi:hypothetical protein